MQRLTQRQILAFITAEQKKQRLTSKAMNDRAGYNYDQLRRMTSGERTMLTYQVIEDYLNVLGFQLAVVPRVSP